ncbi:HAD-IIIA family hydrolase [Sneathiella sp. P13V-1]|uniref:D-glycero-alpha-D-manno-heptose-1,7-bisphosphate 7-phosphatase n=1 Tax=Sneathiella sp. P13V-1 TaxID=2697366 RepID=UPI00187B89D2|nr:HAD-IIIA family hydrolase [Sneathiella sp. P13V-1]MBE7635670.1 HAD-IIIA family hydrolase [Sneathiella sp. P13V-1]
MLILLDRDGVLNEDRPDFVKNPGELIMIPGAAEAVARLKSAGHHLAIVTNQSCIGRGIISDEMLDQIHSKLLQAIRSAGGDIDHIYVAPDAPWEASENRKPGAGMIYQALDRFRTLPEKAVMIGDAKRDLQAAAKAGVHRILVQTGKGVKTQKEGLDQNLMPVSVAANLAEAADFIDQGRYT